MYLFLSYLFYRHKMQQLYITVYESLEPFSVLDLGLMDFTRRGVRKLVSPTPPYFPCLEALRDTSSLTGWRGENVRDGRSGDYVGQSWRLVDDASLTSGADVEFPPLLAGFGSGKGLGDSVGTEASFLYFVFEIVLCILFIHWLCFGPTNTESPVQGGSFLRAGMGVAPPASGEQLLGYEHT